MAKYLPAGFKVLTDELRSSALTLTGVNSHLDLAITSLDSFLSSFEATQAMEDGLYGGSAPGQAFEHYWSTVKPRINTLVSDVAEVGKALNAAAHAYDEAEDKSTDKSAHKKSGPSGTQGKPGHPGKSGNSGPTGHPGNSGPTGPSSTPKIPANSGPNRPS